MDVTRPYKFIGFGAMYVTKPFQFIGIGAMDVTKPYKLIGFGAMHVTKPYKFIRFGAPERTTSRPQDPNPHRRGKRNQMGAGQTNLGGPILVPGPLTKHKKIKNKVSGQFFRGIP